MFLIPVCGRYLNVCPVGLYTRVLKRILGSLPLSFPWSEKSALSSNFPPHLNPCSKQYIQNFVLLLSSCLEVNSHLWLTGKIAQIFCCIPLISEKPTHFQHDKYWKQVTLVLSLLYLSLIFLSCSEESNA